MCRGFEIDQKHIKRTRTGGFWSDFLNFRRQVDVTGWHFKGMLLIKDDVVVYKLIGGQPLIQEMEYNTNPLGPLQGIGESTVRLVFGATAVGFVFVLALGLAGVTLLARELILRRRNPVEP